MQWLNSFSNNFGADPFFTALKPEVFPDYRPLRVNSAQLDNTATLSSQDWHAVLSGKALPQGCAPLASVYSGHQFGQWAGQLGDGRAILLGEVETPSGGLEIQLKGAGKTPYSRMGDGYAVLRSTVREYYASLAMQGLGIPTTGALALGLTGKAVIRETVEEGAVMARTAPSFIRFGHFEHFGNRGQSEPLKQLADYVMERFYLEAASLKGEAKYAAFFKAVCERTASLIAQWQAVGFCHGVMNTDNMSILGLTIDYGPYGFMDTFDAAHICNHSDNQGRYAFYRQPEIGYWNLSALGHSLKALIVDDAAIKDGLNHYALTFNTAHTRLFLQKLGAEKLRDTAQADALVDSTLRCLHEGRADFTQFFRRLSLAAQDGNTQQIRDLFINPAVFDAWLPQYQAAMAQPNAALMLKKNPVFILRNTIAQQAIEACEQGNTDFLDRLEKAMSAPYTELKDCAALYQPPSPDTMPIEVSCSS